MAPLPIPPDRSLCPTAAQRPFVSPPSHTAHRPLGPSQDYSQNRPIPLAGSTTLDSPLPLCMPGSCSTDTALTPQPSSLDEDLDEYIAKAPKGNPPYPPGLLCSGLGIDAPLADGCG